MSFTIVENWDGVTAPTIPAGWNVDTPFVTSTTYQNSSPNSLKLGTVSSGVIYYATNTAADPNGGALVDLTVYTYVDSSASGAEYNVGPAFRCSSAAMDNSTTSCYWVQLRYRQLGVSEVAFSKVVNGVETVLSTASTGVYPVTGEWYSAGVSSTVPDVFNVKVVRLSDGYSLTSTGTFAAGDNFVIAGLYAPDIASGNYSGVAASASDSDMIFVDNINVSTSILVLPRKPVIARIPLQYYITD